MANYTTGPRAQTLRNYPTELDRQLHRAWLVAKCQAKFRKEEWFISEEDYFELWRPHWDQRGRHSEGMVMTRIDWEAPWTVDNTQFIDRLTFLRMAQEWKGVING